jgi:hypothetical protein
MGACASACGGAKDVVADTKAAVAKAAAEREKANAEALMEKIKEAGDIKLDPQVEKDRAYMRGVLDPLTQVIIEYERADSANASSLKMDHLAIWAKLENEEGQSYFCGDKATGTSIHLSAARIQMAAEALGTYQADPSKDSVGELKEAQTEIRGVLKKIDDYMKAEMEWAEAKKKVAEAPEEMPEEKKEKLTEAEEAAKEKVNDAKTDALSEAKTSIKGTDGQIKKAFEIHSKGYVAFDKTIVAATATKPPTVNEWEPKDESNTLGALAANTAAAASIAAAGALRNELAGDTTKMVGEAKRLLEQVKRNVEAWCNEEASKGMVTFHGPKVADEHLVALSKAMSDASGAKDLILQQVYKAGAAKEKQAGKASEKFVEEASKFVDGLEPVSDALKEYETAVKVRADARAPSASRVPAAFARQLLVESGKDGACVCMRLVTRARDSLDGRALRLRLARGVLAWSGGEGAGERDQARGDEEGGDGRDEVEEEGRGRQRDRGGGARREDRRDEGVARRAGQGDGGGEEGAGGAARDDVDVCEEGCEGAGARE